MRNSTTNNDANPTELTYFPGAKVNEKQRGNLSPKLTMHSAEIKRPEKHTIKLDQANQRQKDEGIPGFLEEQLVVKS